LQEAGEFAGLGVLRGGWSFQGVGGVCKRWGEFAVVVEV